MSTKQKVLNILAWLLLPYVAVLVFAFLLGLILGTLHRDIADGGMQFLQTLASLALVVGVVMAILAGFGKPKKLYKQQLRGTK